MFFPEVPGLRRGARPGPGAALELSGLQGQPFSGPVGLQLTHSFNAKHMLHVFMHECRNQIYVYIYTYICIILDSEIRTDIYVLV